MWRMRRTVRVEPLGARVRTRVPSRLLRPAFSVPRAVPRGLPGASITMRRRSASLPQSLALQARAAVPRPAPDPTGAGDAPGLPIGGQLRTAQQQRQQQHRYYHQRQQQQQQQQPIRGEMIAAADGATGDALATDRDFALLFGGADSATAAAGVPPSQRQQEQQQEGRGLQRDRSASVAAADSVRRPTSHSLLAVAAPPTADPCDGTPAAEHERRQRPTHILS